MGCRDRLASLPFLQYGRTIDFVCIFTALFLLLAGIFYTQKLPSYECTKMIAYLSIHYSFTFFAFISNRMGHYSLRASCLPIIVICCVLHYMFSVYVIFTLISIMDSGIHSVSCWQAGFLNEVPLYLWWTSMTTLRIMYILCEVIWCPYVWTREVHPGHQGPGPRPQGPGQEDPDLEEGRRFKIEIVSLESEVTPIDQCSICLENYTVGEQFTILQVCPHKFHSNCLDKWFEVRRTCPLCRINT
jgi:hypothetical protein